MGKLEAGREFQFLEVLGRNVLTNEVVRQFSNLTAKECWESAKRMLRTNHALGGITDLRSSEHLPWSIYKKKESAETFLRWASESRESVRVDSSIRIASGVAREYLETPLHRWEPYSRQGQIWALWRVRRRRVVKNRLDLNKNIMYFQTPIFKIIHINKNINHSRDSLNKG